MVSGTKQERKLEKKNGEYILTTTTANTFSRDELELNKRNYQRQIDHLEETKRELEARLAEIDQIINISE